MLKLQSSLKAICIAVTALTALGCSQEDLVNPSMRKGNTTIVASFKGEGADTRTSVKEDNSQTKVVWNKDDAFGLFYTSSARQSPAVTPFTCPDANGTSSSATFYGTLDDDIETTYAVYPYDKSKTDGGMSLDGTKVTMTLPKEFAYTEASNGPMYAKASDIKQGIQFRHLAGLLKLTVSSKIQSEAKKLVITADKAIAGSCEADLSSTDPVLKVASSGSSNTITVNLDFDAETTSATSFYIPIPAETYATLSAQLFDANDKALSAPKEWSDITVARGGMRTASFGFVKIDVTVSTTNDAIKEAIAQAITEQSPATEVTTPIQIEGAIDATSSGIDKIAIPVYEKSNISLSFASVPTTSGEKPLTLSDAAESTGQTESKNTVTVAIPKVEANQAAPNFTITMPQSTVALDATSAEGTTYGKVTAKTANNTLVIKQGVTVQDLVVAGGNVRVAGKIEKISKDFAETVYLIKEEGATLPADVTGFTVIDAAVYDMKAVAENGGTYVLKTDVVLSEILAVESTMTLDLNGHKITPNSDGLTKGVKYSSTDALILVCRGAKLTINDSSSNNQGSIDCNASVPAAVKLTDVNETGTDDATLIVNGGTFKGNEFGIVGNGLRNGTNVTINGGVVETTNGPGIYQPQDGTLTVTGGRITGSKTGIEIRSGKLVVNGGTIQNTITEFSEKADGNGETITGAAIAVSQHATKHDIDVTINNGNLKGGVYALYEKYLQTAPVGNISMNVTGGNFDGKVYSQNCKAFINGGTFSDPSVLEYLADNANVNVTLNKDYETTALYLPKNRTVTMDLNNHKITIKADAIPATIDVDGVTKNNIYVFVGGNLTLKNGNVENNKRGMAMVSNASKVELNGITYTTTHSDHRGIFNDHNVEGSTITVKNSTMTCQTYAINTNALTNPVGSTTINLESSTFTAGETALMVNIPAKITVTNCTFSGGWQGVFLRGGTATFTDCHINLIFASNYATSNIEQGNTWKDGNQAPAAALTAGNRSAGDYDYKTKITLNNTTFSNSGTDKNSKAATNYPAIYIDTESISSKPNQGVELIYDTASKSSIDAAGKGLVIGNKDNVTVNGSKPQ